MTKAELIAAKEAHIQALEENKREYAKQNFELTKATELWKADIIERANAIINNDAVLVTVAKLWFEEGIEIRVTNDTYPRAKDISLIWEMTVKIKNDGTVLFDSSCWSNYVMKSVENLADMKNSVSIMDTIINYDWASFEIPAIPEYKDFITIVPMKDETSIYDKKIRAAEIEETVNNEEVIKVDCKYYTMYYMVTKATDKCFTYVETSNSGRDDNNDEEKINYLKSIKDSKSYTYRSTKEKFLNKIGRSYEVIC